MGNENKTIQDFQYHNQRIFVLICILPVCFTISCMSNPGNVEPNVPANMTQNVFTSTSGGSIGYWLYTPANAKDNMPLIVYLHGGSGRGNDLNLVINGSLPKFLHDGTVKDI
jgi:poly(3-hydroxybutyrate) depolymerase